MDSECVLAMEQVGLEHCARSKFCEGQGKPELLGKAYWFEIGQQGSKGRTSSLYKAGEDSKGGEHVKVAEALIHQFQILSSKAKRKCIEDAVPFTVSEACLRSCLQSFFQALQTFGVGHAAILLQTLRHRIGN